MIVSAKLIDDIRVWLGEEGLEFWKKIKAEHGRVDAIWMEGSIPHIIHFREGMQVRNKLRDLTNNMYSSHDYDDMWVGIIEKAIEEEKSEPKRSIKSIVVDYFRPMRYKWFWWIVIIGATIMTVFELTFYRK